MKKAAESSQNKVTSSLAYRHRLRNYALNCEMACGKKWYVIHFHISRKIKIKTKIKGRGKILCDLTVIL